MTKLVFTPEFEQKYVRLKEYLDLNFGKNIRRKVTQQINDRIRMLKKYPTSGILLSEISDVQTDYRYFFVAHNYVFYVYTGDTVEIVKMYGEEEDFMQQIFGISSISQESIDYWGD